MAEIKLDPLNVRKYEKRNQQVMSDSLKELGAGQSILIDAAGGKLKADIKGQIVHVETEQ